MTLSFITIIYIVGYLSGVCTVIGLDFYDTFKKRTP